MSVLLDTHAAKIALLVEKGRLRATAPASELRSLLLDAGVVELAVAGDIALLSATLLTADARSHR